MIEKKDGALPPATTLKITKVNLRQKLLCLDINNRTFD